MMKLGRSKHWSQPLQLITGEEKLNPSAILEYFQPLQNFLREENKRLRKEDLVRQNLERHNEAASKQCRKQVKASWDVATDVNNQTKWDILAKQMLSLAQFEKEQYNFYFKNLSATDFQDEKIQRQLKFLSKLGIQILNDDRLAEWTRVKANMGSVYNNAKFCDYDELNCILDINGLSLDPGMFHLVNEILDVFLLILLISNCRNYGYHGEIN